jgi:hypothetical protein
MTGPRSLWTAPAASTFWERLMLKETPAGISRLRIGVCKGSFLEVRSGDRAFAGRGMLAYLCVQH